MAIEYADVDKRNEGQHTVPRGILQNFNIEGTFGKKAQVYVFDKKINKVRPTRVSVYKITKEKGFYNVNIDNKIKTIERPSLANLDDTASGIIKNIIEDKSLGNLTKADRSSLSEFIMIQTVRTKLPRLALAEYFKELGITLNGNELKKLTNTAVIDAEKCASFINNKIWVLFKTSKSKPFYISDHPVVFGGGPYRWDLGITNTKGIELYFPISKTLCLVIFCQSYEKQLLTCASKFKPLMRGLETGCSVPMNEKTVVYHNMLQIDFALREVYSSINDFELAYEMMANARLSRKK